MATIKSFQAHISNTDNLMTLELKTRAVKQTASGKIRFNDNALYDAFIFINEISQQVAYDLLIEWLLECIKENILPMPVKIGNRKVYEELEEEYNRACLETLIEEERAKKLKLKLNNIILQESIREKEKKDDDDDAEKK